MNVQQLREQLQSKNVEASQSWLENQYPARPEERYSKLTYNNFQNIEDSFGKEARTQLEKYLTEHPDRKVVVLASLTKKGNVQKKPVIFIDNPSPHNHDHFATYYGIYELFACSANLDGFVEVFQNLQNGHD